MAIGNDRKLGGACLTFLSRRAIDHGIEDIDQFNNQAPIRRLIHFVKEEKSFFEPRIEREHLRTILCVKGKRSNSRITSQSGAFLLFGLDAVLNESGGARSVVFVRLLHNSAEYCSLLRFVSARSRQLSYALRFSELARMPDEIRPSIRLAHVDL